MLEAEITVSICCITYNQEAYVRDCLDGFILQRTKFPIEIVISDDCSKDSTHAIIEEYKAIYPNLFRDISPNHNLGSIGNFSRTLSMCQGKYIAICEGDDYWTDPYKLQKQVDYLEAHPECGLVYSKARRFYQNNLEFGDFWGQEQTVKDLLFGYSKIPTLTSMFRTEVCNMYHESIKGDPIWPIGDVPLWLYFFYKSEVKYIDECVGVYRVLDNSVCHIQDTYKQCSFFDLSFQCRAFYAERYWGKGLAQSVQIYRVSALLDKMIWKPTGGYSISYQELRSCGIYSPFRWFQLIFSKTRITKEIYKFFVLLFRSIRYRIFHKS